MPQQHHSHLPPHVTFPEDWEHLRTDCVLGCVTRVLHRLPDGRMHVWSSRRHRKARGALVKPSIFIEQAAHDLNVLETLVREHPRRFAWWGWRWGQLNWWIGIIFIIGS
ncbi:MAG: hypothetical protein AAGF10_03140, partial [Verrucomicrobiota bacterium]